MKKYFKRIFGDYILCCLIGLGISVNLFAGYNMNDPWSANLFAIAGTVLFLMLILFASYFNGKSRLLSIPVTLAMLIAVFVMMKIAGAFSGTETIDKSPLLTWIIVASASVLVFWLTRSSVGIIILFLTGSYLTAAFNFLKFPVSLPGYLVLAFGAFVLFFYRASGDSFLPSEPGVFYLKGYFLQSVLASALVILLASGFYYGIVQPLSPPTDEEALAQKLMSMQILEDLGVATKTIAYTEKPIDTSEMLENQQNKENQEQKNKSENNEEQKNQNKNGRIGIGSELIPAMAVTYKKIKNTLWITVPALISILFLAILFKRFLRRKWYKNQIRKTNEDCAAELYLLFTKKMQKAGFKRPSSMTLLEYALASNEKLERFTAYDANFLRLTEIYLAILYGYQHISDKECELFHDYYKDFYRNLRKEMGNFKYYLQFFGI